MIGSFLRKAQLIGGCAATSAPPVPEDLQLAVPGLILPTLADMTWSSGTGPGDPATSYVLEASDDSFSTVAASVTTTSTSATLTGLTENVYYDFRVKAVNCFGDSAYHDAMSGETTPLKTPTGPGSAAGLGATVSGTTITLEWDDESSAETGYQIERSTNGVSWSLIHTTAAGVETYADTGLAAGTYYYRVRAYDSVSTNSSAWLVQTGSSTVASSTYNVEYLVVGGGGAGGKAAGGGGAGGFRTASGFSLTAGTSYTITVGAGGTGGAGRGGSGNDSVFSTITSTGGGGGGGPFPDKAGLNGGSGGGGSRSAGAKGLGTSGQGNDGGQGASGADGASGGGGAGAVGGNGTGNWPNETPGNGGNGSTFYGTTYAGGGGGGRLLGTGDSVGGTGGGGAGRYNVDGIAGSVNTGGGGGGSGDNNGGNGGSGVVIIRMATSNAAGVTTTGSPSITTSGSDTIYTFTASGTLTA